LEPCPTKYRVSFTLFGYKSEGKLYFLGGSAKEKRRRKFAIPWRYYLPTPRNIHFIG
jgi:hypothetical protein